MRKVDRQQYSKLEQWHHSSKLVGGSEFRYSNRSGEWRHTGGEQQLEAHHAEAVRVGLLEEVDRLDARTRRAQHKLVAARVQLRELRREARADRLQEHERREAHVEPTRIAQVDRRHWEALRRRQRLR